jgi:hypothetical protein
VAQRIEVTTRRLMPQEVHGGKEAIRLTEKEIPSIESRLPVRGHPVSYVRGRGISLPSMHHVPEPELAYVLEDAEPAVLVVLPELRKQAAAITASRNTRVLDVDRLVFGEDDGPEPKRAEVTDNDAALLL